MPGIDEIKVDTQAEIIERSDELDYRGRESPSFSKPGHFDLLKLDTAPMTVLAQDPEIIEADQPITVQIPVPAGRLQPGPANHRFHVVDVGARGAPAQPPVGLHEPGHPWTYVDEWSGRASGDLARQREFRAQNVFAIAAHTLALFERRLGRRVPWRSGWPHLFLVAKGMLGGNAAYMPDRQAVVFGYLPALDGHDPVYACLSYDVIAHEVTHAILDGLRPRYVEPGLPDQLAFHEGLADVVAMLSVFELAGVAKRLLMGEKKSTRISFCSDGAAEAIADPNQRKNARIAGRRDLLTKTALLGLGEQLGRARALRDQQPDLGAGDMPLRRSVDLEPDDTILEKPEYQEAHRRAEVLVAAVMRTLAGMWASRIDALDPRGGLDADRVAEEGVRAAGHLLRMVLQSLDYLPPVELEFADVIDCIITADTRLTPDDDFNYRDTLKQAFADFGIQPSPHHMLDVDGQVAPEPGGQQPSEDPDNPPDRIRYEHLNLIALRTSPEEVFSFIWNNSAALGIDVRLATRVDRVITTTRVGADGLIVTEILADYTQWIGTTAGELPAGMHRPDGLPEDVKVEMWGGGVLVFDQFGRFRLQQRKPVLDTRRQQARLDNLVARAIHDSKGGYGTTDGTPPGERFALLHEMRSEDSW
ncbi:MAG TPA: hypothetical protein VGB75_11420 [Jatrophihabitans sp.]|jgi:hypothetical protein|uniref:hypothetical protein n=1 Tax=Jatrophihabitans sp. TaxID=1932789 RepID=UPI002F229137